MTDNAVRLTYPQYRAVRRLVHDCCKDTAAWLAREYSGGDSTKLLLARAGSSVEMELPWPKVQRRIAQLIADGTFLTEQERQPERQEQDARRYQVVVYHHSENGFDERMEYPTREEAEKVAQGYVDGTMEPDGFAYDGAAVYDLEQRTYCVMLKHTDDRPPKQRFFIIPCFALSRDHMTIFLRS